ncbi:molybdopterin-guanine dinucleotide biosynthesis protein B [Natronococcus occultus]|uniref:Molybdopterin guanine dinucleotide biosynthesis accessory protein MobB n=1 Tax=Natronococcus occultus SP4 TaxID=694430 RepID=L0JYL4_9EURY|nr:molybdopterin-guanine dinucleotide biosynthesis protein B [Natronococcus occultus]AGB37390.1 molybdopterin guanine dinucleotide biosynthesis accessory protein MobB [Natronococcus occultus SP4]
MRAVCLAGPSDSGKTTLVEKLVPRLAEAGRVATVKSIHHDIEIDTPGADTHRHRTAGAETVVGVTPELTIDITARGKEEPPREPDADYFETTDSELRALSRVLTRLDRRGYDVVLVEGFAEAPLPTILVGDRDPDAVGGEVVGRGRDDLATLVETVLALDPLEERSADGD